MLISFALLTGLQLVDVIVHIATGQVEPIRITSNVIISAGAIAALFSPFRATQLVLGTSLLYLVLNLAFLLQQGVVDPATGGLRISLYIFIIGSLALAAWYRQRLKAGR
ncbi:MAG: hypothetical protein AAF940_09365 [Pseudomonadota bacterium]